MDDELPAPPVAADLSLRGRPLMPLDVVRLTQSDIFALSTGDEFKAAVALWCAAWLQVPAGSLPDNDRVLARLSGAGANWSAVKVGAMRGWAKHSDGRLYHRVVGEMVDIAVESLIGYRRHVASATARQQRWRETKREMENAAREQGFTVPPNATKAELRILLASRVTAAETPETSTKIYTAKPAAPPPSTLPPPPSTGRLYDPLNTGMADIYPDEETGRSMAFGFDIQKVVDLCLAAAKLPPDKTRKSWGAVIGWLGMGFLPNEFIAIISRLAARPEGAKAFSLTFFDKPIRAECKTAPVYGKPGRVRELV